LFRAWPVSSAEQSGKGKQRREKTSTDTSVGLGKNQSGCEMGGKALVEAFARRTAQKEANYFQRLTPL